MTVGIGLDGRIGGGQLQESRCCRGYAATGDQGLDARIGLHALQGAEGGAVRLQGSTGVGRSYKAVRRSAAAAEGAWRSSTCGCQGLQGCL